MEKFIDIKARAIQRKGSEKMLNSLLSKPLPSQDLLTLPDDTWLEELTRKIFQSGFYWSVINNKWPGFREVFWDFNITKLLMMSPEMYEQRAIDQRIVRNYNKVKTIAVNTMMIHSIAQLHGSFSKFIYDWPSEDIIGLWAWLKKNGARLGGNTGAYSLRVMGKDTFILSRDIESYFRSNKIIDGGLQTKKSLITIQSFFNEMQQQSGLSLQEISQTISYSVGDNTVGFNQ
ncbi:3-methyladenine DNA glycosylase [Pseudoalteromonas sp. NBT06-2]|uniref:DNA-3-methyladenine glycosylase I n=1 Tax=Pseudoalteromonas sp. NBT06-2 TaxID=2025950 RepID=UPI000BA61869|nr:DNA-3-methyladenine glycosylase I [Pseudoalteromonas sp. NBT06-2]PAJ74029.1 3-methyladenine DNA glycosylase [Pseudoalteromonas sp. NBT06-2]